MQNLSTPLWLNGRITSCTCVGSELWVTAAPWWEFHFIHTLLCKTSCPTVPNWSNKQSLYTFGQRGHCINRSFVLLLMMISLISLCSLWAPKSLSFCDICLPYGILHCFSLPSAQNYFFQKCAVYRNWYSKSCFWHHSPLVGGLSTTSAQTSISGLKIQVAGCWRCKNLLLCFPRHTHRMFRAVGCYNGIGCRSQSQTL